MSYLCLSADDLENEHICCAISDKKCAAGYQLKKDWLAEQFSQGYQFIRLDERGKVFIEFGPCEQAFAPVLAPNFLLINCFWISGKFKNHGHGKALLQKAITHAKKKKCDGLVTIVGAKKFHCMSDGKWLKRQGFEVVDTSPLGFELIALKLNAKKGSPQFSKAVREGKGPKNKGLTVYYSNQCPFTDYYVNHCLVESAEKRGLSLKIVKLETIKQAQQAITPATIFSLFYDGNFITTDLSVCKDSRFDKVLDKALKE